MDIIHEMHRNTIGLNYKASTITNSKTTCYQLTDIEQITKLHSSNENIQSLVACSLRINFVVQVICFDYMFGF